MEGKKTSALSRQGKPLPWLHPDHLRQVRVRQQEGRLSGHPAPSLHWYLHRRRLAAATVKEDQTQGAVISQLDLLVERERRGQAVRCVVEYSALQSHLEASAELDIQCE